MKRTIILCLLLSIFYSAGAYKIETSSHVYFVITQEGQYATLGVVPSTLLSVDEKEYMNYMGVILGDEERLLVDSLLMLRKDGTKYLCYDSKTHSEHLLFDFGLKKGDTFTNDFDGTTYKVTDVRDSLVNDEKLCLVELLSQEGKQDVWLEGVGSLYTGILYANEFYRNARLLISRNYESEDWESVIEEQPIYCFPNNQNIKTGNMSVSFLQWDKPIETDADWEAYYEWSRAPTNLNAEFLGDTLHIWGRQNISCWLYSYAACEVKGSQISFKLYPYDFIHEMDHICKYEIDVKISGFEKGKYTINLSWNKILELECLGNNPTSVNITTSPSSKVDIYDLQGRKIGSGKSFPLKGVMGSGIYIEGGKKKVK